MHKKGEESEKIEGKAKGGRLEKEKSLKSFRKLKGRKERGGKKRERGDHDGNLWWKRRVKGGRK